MKQYISALLVGTMIAATVSPLVKATPFDDIKGHWAEKEINNLVNSCAVKGYPDGSFKPDNIINFDEFVVMVMNELMYKPMGANSDYWAQGYINTAISRNIFEADFTDNFNRPITREEMSVILVNAFSIEGGTNEFSPADENEIDEKYSEYVQQTYKAGIMSGYPDGSFRPKGHLTRAEACRVIREAKYYINDDVFEYIVYDLKDAHLENSPWSFYSTSENQNYLSNYRSAPIVVNDNVAIAAPDPSYPRPQITWNTADKNNKAVNILAEKGNEIIVMFTAPEDGNYLFNINCKNIGTDVYGGDGGSFSFKFLEEESEIDSSRIKGFEIPISNQNPEAVTWSENIQMKKGQKITVRFGVHADGYGDCFNVEFRAETTEEAGKIYENNGIISYLSKPPEEKKATGAAYREGMVWLGAGGQWTDHESAIPIIETMKKYIPNLAIAELSEPDYVENNVDYYAKSDIPVLTQSYGSVDPFSYFTETDAWERNWNNIPTGEGGHGHAIPHESTWEFIERVIRSAIRRGKTGYGYMDYIWLWAMGRGIATFNPQTLEAFREDLKGEDSGIWLEFNGEEKCWMFKDFAEYYTGVMLTPNDLGLESWDDFTPMTSDKFIMMQGQDHTQNNLLVDLLMTYEWLKLAQFMCDVAEEEGGVTQVMPNPEDAANAGDLLFLSSLSGIDMVTEEYFNETEYLDGAYYHYDYLTSQKSKDASSGIVLECGTGGHNGSYYDNAIAYAAAYELTAATGITHLEADFMVDRPGTVEEWSQYKVYKDNYQAIMGFALGFNHAREDMLKKKSPDFISVTSRRVNRPWGDTWSPWSWLLQWKGSPEKLLARNGYIYEGIGEDGVTSIKPGQEIVVYSPDRPNKYHFDYMIESLKSGDFKRILTNAASIEGIIDEKYNQKAMNEVYPEYAFTKNDGILISGTITDSEGNIVADNINIESTSVYENADYEVVLKCNDIPLLVKKDIGDGELYICCIDPNEEINYYASLAIYDYLLGKVGIKKHYETLEATGELPDVCTDWGTVAGRGEFGKNAAVRLYENGDLKVVGIQHPLSQNFVGKEDMMQKMTVSYELKNAKTKVKARLDANTEYKYIAIPSGIKGSVHSDDEGFVELSFENTGHEIFYCLPATTENDEKISKVAQRLLDWNDSLTYDGRIGVEDTFAPVTTVRVNGKEENNVYKDEVEVVLTAKDTDNGSGVAWLEYAVDSDKFKSETNRSVIDGGVISKTIKLSGSGKHTILYRSRDYNGNIEETGSVEIDISEEQK